MGCIYSRGTTVVSGGFRRWQCLPPPPRNPTTQSYRVCGTGAVWQVAVIGLRGGGGRHCHLRNLRPTHHTKRHFNEVPHEDRLVKAPVEKASEGDEVDKVEEVDKTLAKMLEAATETSDIGPVVGVAEVVETVDASRVRSSEFEVTGTTTAAGPTKELSLEPSMHEVHEGEGEADVAASDAPVYYRAEDTPRSVEARGDAFP
ncbi:hypothetical protein Nepgr_014913 [Nepenthes gracilis]|uniref:Uncharacterized protein n=1 Tax=Nepenthes gracilis TaxID=150966 RepID=A0AAD3SKZ5_NEPGR|nr:hypothetical protein Nepgr_014913 [Nepenthes gracilis]